MAEMIDTEVCPDCGSLEVRAVEPGWFRIDLDRRAELVGASRDDEPLDDGFLERLDLTCRDCGLVWG